MFRAQRYRPQRIAALSRDTHPNTIKDLADGTQVQYRIQRRSGVNFIVIVSLETGKEGWYYTDK